MWIRDLCACERLSRHSLLNTEWDFFPLSFWIFMCKMLAIRYAQWRRVCLLIKSFPFIASPLRNKIYVCVCVQMCMIVRCLCMRPFEFLFLFSAKACCAAGGLYSVENGWGRGRWLGECLGEEQGVFFCDCLFWLYLVETKIFFWGEKC